MTSSQISTVKSEISEEPRTNVQPPKRLRRWVWVILWMGVIFVFSAQPQSALNFGQPAFVGKLAHVTEYLILGWLIQRAFGGRSARRTGWQAWLIALVYAATDELHQMFVPGRASLATDVLIDSAGAAIGIAIAVQRERTSFDI